MSSAGCSKEFFPKNQENEIIEKVFHAIRNARTPKNNMTGDKMKTIKSMRDRATDKGFPQ